MYTCKVKIEPHGIHATSREIKRELYLGHNVISNFALKIIYTVQRRLRLFRCVFILTACRKCMHRRSFLFPWLRTKRWLRNRCGNNDLIRAGRKALSHRAWMSLCISTAWEWADPRGFMCACVCHRHGRYRTKAQFVRQLDNPFINPLRTGNRARTLRGQG